MIPVRVFSLKEKKYPLPPHLSSGILTVIQSGSREFAMMLERATSEMSPVPELEFIVPLYFPGTGAVYGI